MRSMTGYSRFTYEDENFILNMEIKSVNNKNLTLKIKIPYNLNFLESAIRTKLSSKIFRGYLDMRIDFEDKRENLTKIEYDKNLSASYLNTLTEIENDNNALFTNKLDFLISNFNIIKKGNLEINENEYHDFILGQLDNLINPFIESREVEGKRLKEFFNTKILDIELLITEIKKYKDKVVENYKNRMLERLNNNDKKLEFDEESILKELMIFTDRSDISEELVRLDSHIKQLKIEVNSSEHSNGKKIEFILQEIFRELNTSGVKSNMYEISKLVIDCKNELEKIREQIMNIE